jgi:hypothetical protein
MTPVMRNEAILAGFMKALEDLKADAACLKAWL